MLPFVANRPLAVIRAPDGITGETFFQKSFTTHVPKHVIQTKLDRWHHGLFHQEDRRARGARTVRRDRNPPVGRARCRAADKPDFLTWDLDPDDSVPWKEVLGAALLLRDFLARARALTVVKTSGGKGLHIMLHLQADPHVGRDEGLHQGRGGAAWRSSIRAASPSPPPRRSGRGRSISTGCATAAAPRASRHGASAPGPARRFRCQSHGRSFPNSIRPVLHSWSGGNTARMGGDESSRPSGSPSCGISACSSSRRRLPYAVVADGGPFRSSQAPCPGRCAAPAPPHNRCRRGSPADLRCGGRRFRRHR